MKNLYIVGNWKENKSEEESLEFIDQLEDFESKSEVNVVICPTFTSLSGLAKILKTKTLPLKLGAQNVSEFEEGAFTGEVSARQIAEFAKFAIIGHSERRKYQGESDEVIKRKTEIALKYGVEPILCVVNEDVPVPDGVKIVAYEPVSAIGTGNPDTPDNAQMVAKRIKGKNSGVEYVLYGGSVKPENVQSFTEKGDISGVLVGGASLDPATFLSIIKAC